MTGSTASHNQPTRARVFVLEDDPQRIRLFREALFHADATFAESCAEAIQKFKPPYAVMSLDHDLGGQVFVNSTEENTGAGFCRWLPETDVEAWYPVVVVHSYNPDGASTMMRTLRDKGYRAIQQPFGPSVLSFLSAVSEASDAVDPHAAN
jgi:CheY-like chemotaxis protein